MNNCLQCKKEYEAKRGTSKFCSTNCRVKYNRKNGNKKSVGKVELEVLYNKILDLVDKFEKPTESSFKGEAINIHKYDEVGQYTEPKRQLIRTFEQYRQLRLDCENEEDWQILADDIRNAPNLSTKQKQLLLN